MKRFWVGTVTLVLLLVACFWTAEAMENIHKPVRQTLAMAADAAVKGDWETAEALATDARTSWEKHWQVTASFADHTPMDDVDGLFAQLPVFAAEGEATHFASTCAQLSKLVEAIEEAHGLNWRNLL